MGELLKICTRCKEPKPHSRFNTRGKSLRSWCKDCCAEIKRLKYAEDPDLNRARVYAWRRANPEKAQKSDWKNHLKTYGLTVEDYEALLVAQGGVCAICKGPACGRPNVRKLFVDHDHKTGKVRGLLCHRCNYLLGYAKDLVEILRAAIVYLERSNGF